MVRPGSKVMGERKGKGLRHTVRHEVSGHRGRILQDVGKYVLSSILVSLTQTYYLWDIASRLTVVNEDTEQLCVVSGHPLCSEGGEGLDKQVIRDTNWVVGTVQ